MRCHYEILGISMDSTTEDIKRAYRKLALEWHPDKNLHQLQEATEQFQLIQQAYDVLIDPHERAWYDRHRDEILKGGLDDDYKDNSVDVFQYFNTSCFSGYGDDTKSFYAVYQNVFDQIAAEDRPFMEEDVEIPRFGSSDSSYEEVVHPFYSYWQSYCTQKPFYWVDKYDIREAPNRKVLRLMEKENKKLRDQAKKKRNEEVRHLVEYVRKRDKRMQAYKIKLEEKSAENARKMEQERRRQILERQKNLENYKETEWASMSQLEGNLQEIEAELDKAFGRESSEKDYDNECSVNSSDDEVNNDDLYCAACDKAFKSDKAFSNHEKSKKHKQNVAALKEILKDEEEHFAPEDTETAVDTTEEQNKSVLMTDLTNKHEEPSRKGKKKKQKKSNLKNDEGSDQEEMPDLIEQCEQQEEDVNHSNSNSSIKEEKPGSMVSKNDNHFKDAAPTVVNPNNAEPKENECLEDRNQVKSKKNKGQKKPSKSSSKDTGSQNTCFSCHTEFLSRNKLFEHLKSTGHAMYIPPPSKANKEESKHGVQEKSKLSQKKGKR